MIERLEIESFALIERLIFEPGQGLLVLSGETGAGKSLLIDAISVVSGRRAGKDLIRSGADRARIEASVSVAPGLLPDDLVQALGIDDQAPASLLISRELTTAGKTFCRIDGRLVPLTLLQEVCSFLFDIHGQHDQQALFRVSEHVHLLDRFGGAPVAQALQDYRTLLGRERQIAAELAELGADPAARERRRDLLRYQANEIEAARLKPDEEAQLIARRQVAAHAEKIRQALGEAWQELSNGARGDGGGGILEAFGRAVGRLEQIARYSPELAATAADFREAQIQLQTLAGDLVAHQEQIEADPSELIRLDERLDLIFRLKKKYGQSISDVLTFRQEALSELERLDASESRFAALEHERTRIRAGLVEAARLLSAQREQAVDRLKQQIGRELAELDLPRAVFDVRFDPQPGDPESFGRDGLDRVEFLFSANSGEPPRPLARIASGGEASRIMLAIRTILAQADQIPVVVFDEIDAGIGGRTAARVGIRLRRLGRQRQVFCITHMAQIAAMADQHWLIEKQTADTRTSTSLRQLTAAEQEREVARLLSGGIAGAEALELAARMIEHARSQDPLTVKSDR